MYFLSKYISEKFLKMTQFYKCHVPLFAFAHRLFFSILWVFARCRLIAKPVNWLVFESSLHGHYIITFFPSSKIRSLDILKKKLHYFISSKIGNTIYHFCLTNWNFMVFILCLFWEIIYLATTKIRLYFKFWRARKNVDSPSKRFI